MPKGRGQHTSLGQRRWAFPFSLLVVWAATLVLVLPTIHAHLDNPNMVIYGNGDEGGQMDLIWSYYSGEHRDSFQWDFDYGLEMVYLAGAAKLLLAPWMTVTPVTFVVLLRWIHFLSWLAALGLFWRLVGRHAGRGWPQQIGVLLLAVRPAWAYLANNWKPEPLVLVLLLLGLDAVLRYVEQPSRVRLAVASLCAAAAFTVKYFGLMLLPAIAAALYRDRRRRADAKSAAVPLRRASWMIYALGGTALLGFIAAALLGYVRKSTGMTWAAQYGFWRTLHLIPVLMKAWLLGWGLIAASGAMALLRRQAAWRRRIDALNSALCAAAAGFAAWMLITGAGWLLHPRQFIIAYSQLVPIALHSHAEPLHGGWVSAWLQHVGRIMRQGVGAGLCAAAVIALVAAFLAHRRGIRADSLVRNKQAVLLWFCAGFALLIASMVRCEPHHLLPLVSALVLLILLEVRTMARLPAGRRVLLPLLGVLIALEIAANARLLIETRLQAARYRDDVVYDVQSWWEQHMPREAVILADHYVYAYIPPGYPHLTVLQDYNLNPKMLRDTAENIQPQFLYINEGHETPVPPVSELLPAYQAEVVKIFDSQDRRFRRKPADRFVIYRLTRRG